MDWWGRLLGSTPSKPTLKRTVNGPEVRHLKFKQNWETILGLLNRPRNLATEGPLLEQLQVCLERIATIIREESRAPVPHLTLQFAASNKIYTVVCRAATASQHEPIIHATLSILAALIDSEEEDFLSNANFVKSTMRMVTKVIESETLVVGTQTETAILELLFTVSAKIRLQPEILAYWFHSTAKPELDDVFAREKSNFVGITAKEDFPLCYLLIDRVHHDGRIGDFARTGLLYIFEATGRSLDLEEWVVSSDLPTLMATGLGALYSQLSRELSVLHPDATLPAVLAMSDYSTTHQRATAESAFSESHKRDMATFLSYLTFWQDVLDHCRSADVKQTLLDHFQILFLQQLLYPSLLQSSDTDAGSSVAVLTYIAAMVDCLEYPALMRMTLEYLLAIQDSAITTSDTKTIPMEPPRSPTAIRRKESLVLLTKPKNPDEAVEPALFSLADLILNNIGSTNNQSVFAALKLSSTILIRQRMFAFGTLLRVQKPKVNGIGRTVGALEVEVDKYCQLATSFHDHFELQDAFTSLAEDMRTAIEAQIPFQPPSQDGSVEDGKMLTGRYVISSDDHFVRLLMTLMRTFFTNSVDVNLALSQAIISIALCMEIRLDGWLALDPSDYTFPATVFEDSRPWQSHLDEDELDIFTAFQGACKHPEWPENKAPYLYTTLQALSDEIDNVRSSVPNLSHLISVRKTMLQATSLSTPLLTSNPPSLANSPTRVSFADALSTKGDQSSGKSQAGSLISPHNEANNITFAPSHDVASSPVLSSTNEQYSSPDQSAKPLRLASASEMPSTTDLLMQEIIFSPVQGSKSDDETGEKRKATLNHVLTNVVILQEFILELVAVLQVRAAVLAEKEVCFT